MERWRVGHERNHQILMVESGYIWIRVRARWRQHHTVSGRLCYPAFNSNSFATSAVLAEVCALLSDILDNYVAARWSEGFYVFVWTKYIEYLS